MSGGMAWPAMGVVGGGEAPAAAQPATGGRSMRHDRRCFGRLGQEDQRLKKHYGCWMDIVDHAVPRAPRRWTTARPRKGKRRSRGRRGSGCTRGEEYEGSLVRLRCRHRRITGGVGELRDGLASGGSSRGR